MKKSILLIFMIVLSINLFSLEIKDGKIVDNAGNSIELKEYKRIIVTDPAITEILYEIGGQDIIVATNSATRSGIYPKEASSLPSVGTITNPDIEKIVFYNPDLIILNSMVSKSADAIKKLNIPVLISEVKDLETIIINIKILGEISGKKDSANKLMTASIEKLEALKNKKYEGKIKGAVIYSTSPLMAFNSKSLPGQVLNILQVENISDNVIGDKPILSPEFILKENPDIILGAMTIATPNQIIEASSVIPLTNAGKNKNIFITNSSIILRGSHRIFEEISELEEKVNKIRNK